MPRPRRKSAVALPRVNYGNHRNFPFWVLPLPVLTERGALLCRAGLDWTGPDQTTPLRSSLLHSPICQRFPRVLRQIPHCFVHYLSNYLAMVATPKVLVAYAAVAVAAINGVSAAPIVTNPFTKVADVVPLKAADHPARGFVLKRQPKVEVFDVVVNEAAALLPPRRLRALEESANGDIERLEKYFGERMERNFNVLNDNYKEAEFKPSPWPSSYWPMYKDGLNYRWNGNEPSAAEKYAKAFGKDVDAFKEGISKKSGVLSQSDNKSCREDSDCDGDYCGKREGESADVDTVFTGARYDGPSDSDAVDRFGRFTDAARRDLGPGYFHIAFSNIMGKHGKSFVIDTSADAPVWNQPIRGYSVKNVQIVDPAVAGAVFFGASAYPFNDDAKKVAYVETEIAWVFEREDNRPYVPDHAEDATHRELYTYVLELNGDDEIIGGEWVGKSRAEHPDFLWFAAGKAPLDTVTSFGLSNADVQELLAMSIACNREDVVMTVHAPRSNDDNNNSNNNNSNSDNNSSNDNTSSDDTSRDNTSSDNTSNDNTSNDNTSNDNTSDDNTSSDNNSDDNNSDDNNNGENIIDDVVPLKSADNPARGFVLKREPKVEVFNVVVNEAAAMLPPLHPTSRRLRTRTLEESSNGDLERLEKYFDERMERNFNVLNDNYKEAEIKNTPWPSSYWPMYKDGLNYRWDGDEPSPAEKYAIAFGKDVEDDAVDRFGRFTDAARRDLGAGYFHIAFSNIMGKHGKSFVIDTSPDAAVWNQPIRGYKVKSAQIVDPAVAGAIFFGASAYPFNDDAKKVAYVETEIAWIFEREDNRAYVPDHIEDATHYELYTYVLELDDDDEIIGGEWVGESRAKHPDFLWLTTDRASRDEVTGFGLSNADVQELLEMSVACDN
ncbi:TPA: hypothetical protein N0F65_006013 [Lagenidium giganteum]|uniref:Uncharacterized protein n=1 Tax=Lagenidium giganteum TaxID=4803 RepID=A0AAV2ZB79_9STRA|nr:TPA: hypothetical protein N0F65_006013 [Lagenidium giganteum]